MPEFFSSDGSFLLQFVVIFLVILVLLMGAVLLFRRLAGRGLSVSARAGKSDRQPRLGIVDIYELDRQRQLILLRRDNVEHLLLVGGPNDVVVERNVQRGARLPSEALLRPDIADDEAGRGLGGPDEEQNSRDPAPSSTFAPSVPPTFEMPVVVPPPLPGSRSPAPVQAPSLDPRLFEPDETDGDALAPSRPRASRLLRRTPPPLVEPRPEPASERPAGTLPIMASGEPRPVDPAVLSDMAHQLEVALRRPSSAVTPPPSIAPSHMPSPAPDSDLAAPQPATEPAEPPSRVADPVAAGMAAAQVLSPALPAGRTQPRTASGEATPGGAAPLQADHAALGIPDRAEPHAASAATPSAPPAEPPVAKAAVEAEPVVETTPKTPPAPGPTPRAAPPAAETLQSGTEPSPKDAAEAKPQSSPAPFSVEEIEAEFARLLGRPVDKKS